MFLEEIMSCLCVLGCDYLFLYFVVLKLVLLIKIILESVLCD